MAIDVLQARRHDVDVFHCRRQRRDLRKPLQLLARLAHQLHRAAIDLSAAEPPGELRGGRRLRLNAHPDRQAGAGAQLRQPAIGGHTAVAQNDDTVGARLQFRQRMR